MLAKWDKENVNDILEKGKSKMDCYSHIAIIIITHKRYTWLQSMSLSKVISLNQSTYICIYMDMYKYRYIHLI